MQILMLDFPRLQFGYILSEYQPGNHPKPRRLWKAALQRTALAPVCRGARVRGAPKPQTPLPRQKACRGSGAFGQSPGGCGKPPSIAQPSPQRTRASGRGAYNCESIWIGTLMITISLFTVNSARSRLAVWLCSIRPVA